MLFTCLHAKTPTLYSDKILGWQEPRVFLYKIRLIFFFYKRFFHFFLEIVYMLFTNFHTKMPKLYSRQNSWSIGPKGKGLLCIYTIELRERKDETTLLLPWALLT